MKMYIHACEANFNTSEKWRKNENQKALEKLSIFSRKAKIKIAKHGFEGICARVVQL